MKTRKIGRDAGNGRFIPVQTARIRRDTAIVQTIKVKTPKK
jgi:hypothetical protein